MSQPIRLPINAPSYSAGGANFYIDKTGAIYQTWVGRTVAGGDWGSHVYRTAPGAPSQLLFFQPNINGYLEVMNKQLWFGYCDAKGAQWRLLTQMLTKAQIKDIVWAKIWDVNYLIRLDFINGSSPIQQVQDYLVDLATYIKRIVK